jgi:8-oxo-dGTP pyrophosphatase MutT (NUDIX family)
MLIMGDACDGIAGALIDAQAMSSQQPQYACAFLSDARGWWLLQLRPVDHALAAGQLTCFGGRLHAHETAEAGLRRELHEELHWCPRQLSLVLEMWQGSIWIASFYRGELEVPLQHLTTEPGHVAILAPWPSLPGLPMSPWHDHAFRAFQRADKRLDLA